MTVYPGQRYFVIVFDLAGDSTITRCVHTVLGEVAMENTNINQSNN